MKICILGLGYIGLPTSLLFATSGHQVLGIDINPKVVKSLNDGKLHFEEKGMQKLFEKTIKDKTFRASEKVEPSDVFIVCVQTPLDKSYNVSDLNYVKTACEMVYPHLKKGNLVIIESTISPGSSETLFRKVLEKSGLKVEQDFHLIHCPERAIPGNTVFEMINNHRIVGGMSKKGLAKAKELYQSFVPEDKITLTDIRTAEIVKLMENTYRDLNIALANEFAMISEDLGIDVWDAIKLANYHPRVNIHKPGPGVGGHCLAIDPWFLTEQSFNAQLIQQARSVNDSMPTYTLLLTKKLLDSDAAFPTITILGVAYKGNVDDARETPALKFIHLAEKQGYLIKIHDPHVIEFHGRELLSLDEAVKDSDCIVVITDHDAFKEINPEKIGKMMKHKKVLDARNILDHKSWEKAGFEIKVLGKNPNQLL
ncbi:MAG: nucleotide sugar dehydrogenase [Asgard group archaeon]|nr:nucleotide sugar dehydrogenase [Asgard group archaeon]